MLQSPVPALLSEEMRTADTQREELRRYGGETATRKPRAEASKEARRASTVRLAFRPAELWQELWQDACHLGLPVWCSLRDGSAGGQAVECPSSSWGKGKQYLPSTPAQPAILGVISCPAPGPSFLLYLTNEGMEAPSHRRG